MKSREPCRGALGAVGRYPHQEGQSLDAGVLNPAGSVITIKTTRTSVKKNDWLTSADTEKRLFPRRANTNTCVWNVPICSSRTIESQSTVPFGAQDELQDECGEHVLGECEPKSSVTWKSRNEMGGFASCATSQLTLGQRNPTRCEVPWTMTLPYRGVEKTLERTFSWHI